MSFHWHGKTKKGAGKWVGTWNAPPLWFGLIFAGYGALAGTAGLVGLLAMLLFPLSKIGTLVSVGLIHGLVFGGTGAWMLWMRRRILSLSTTDDLCKRLGIDEKTLERVAEENGIRPIYNINEKDYYDSSQFGDSLVLLRAAAAPTAAPETLLRASAPTPSETPAEQLLRATDSAPQPISPENSIINTQDEAPTITNTTRG